MTYTYVFRMDLFTPYNLHMKIHIYHQPFFLISRNHRFHEVWLVNDVHSTLGDIIAKCTSLSFSINYRYLRCSDYLYTVEACGLYYLFIKHVLSVYYNCTKNVPQNILVCLLVTCFVLTYQN